MQQRQTNAFEDENTDITADMSDIKGDIEEDIIAYGIDDSNISISFFNDLKTEIEQLPPASSQIMSPGSTSSTNDKIEPKSGRNTFRARPPISKQQGTPSTKKLSQKPKKEQRPPKPPNLPSPPQNMPLKEGIWSLKSRYERTVSKKRCDSKETVKNSNKKILKKPKFIPNSEQQIKNSQAELDENDPSFILKDKKRDSSLKDVITRYEDSHISQKKLNHRDILKEVISPSRQKTSEFSTPKH